jgi:PhoPQ-activated pathogenicity-related protein
VTDALNNYWDGLRGPKCVLYAPNSGHGLDDFQRVLATTVGFFHYVAGEKPFPKIAWQHDDADGRLRLRISSDIAPAGARLWVARSASMDFRKSKWEEAPMTASAGGFVGEVERPKEGGLAVFGEADYSIEGRSFTLSTQVRMVSAK